MDYLWTPWRYHFVTHPPAEPGVCVFCRAAAADDRQALVVHRAAHSFVILNRFPYTSGHVMVVPFAHVATIEDLPEPALAEMMCLARDAVKHLRAIYRPDGRNLGMNLGLMPVTGIPLPFFSYGGSNLLLNLLAIGLLLNIRARRQIVRQLRQFVDAPPNRPRRTPQNSRDVFDPAAPQPFGFHRGKPPLIPLRQGLEKRPRLLLRLRLVLLAKHKRHLRPPCRHHTPDTPSGPFLSAILPERLYDFRQLLIRRS